MDEQLRRAIAVAGHPAGLTNNLNIPKPPEGQPTLLTFDGVNNAFHEFGHALHGLFSDVQYPQFAGTNVPRDFYGKGPQIGPLLEARGLQTPLAPHGHADEACSRALSR